MAGAEGGDDVAAPLTLKPSLTLALRFTLTLTSGLRSPIFVGSPAGAAATGSSRNAMHRTLSSDKLLFAAVIGLVLFGIVMVNSASSAVSTDEFGTPYHYVIRQAMWAAVGLVGMCVTMSVDYRVYNKPGLIYAGFGVVVLMLLAVFAFPTTPKPA